MVCLVVWVLPHSFKSCKMYKKYIKQVCSLIDEANSYVITNQRLKSHCQHSKISLCVPSSLPFVPQRKLLASLYGNTSSLLKNGFTCYVYNNIVCFSYFRLKNLESHCMLCLVPFTKHLHNAHCVSVWFTHFHYCVIRHFISTTLFYWDGHLYDVFHSGLLQAMLQWTCFAHKHFCRVFT